MNAIYLTIATVTKTTSKKTTTSIKVKVTQKSPKVVLPGAVTTLIEFDASSPTVNQDLTTLISNQLHNVVEVPAAQAASPTTIEVLDAHLPLEVLPTVLEEIEIVTLPEVAEVDPYAKPVVEATILPTPPTKKLTKLNHCGYLGLRVIKFNPTIEVEMRGGKEMHLLTEEGTNNVLAMGPRIFKNFVYEICHQIVHSLEDVTIPTMKIRCTVQKQGTMSGFSFHREDNCA